MQMQKCRGIMRQIVRCLLSLIFLFTCDCVAAGPSNSDVLICKAKKKRGERGERGRRGKKGKHGKPGLAGPPGPVGANGVTGAPGATGATGTISPIVPGTMSLSYTIAPQTDTGTYDVILLDPNNQLVHHQIVTCPVPDPITITDTITPVYQGRYALLLFNRDLASPVSQALDNVTVNVPPTFSHGPDVLYVANPQESGDPPIRQLNLYYFNL